MKTSAFTLIEMVIVIVIIWVITIFSIGGIWNQMQKLQNKTTKETFLASYQKVYSSNLTTSMKGWNVYSWLTITFKQWWSWFSISYTWDKKAELQSFNQQIIVPHLTIYAIKQREAITYTNLTQRSEINEDIQLQLKPYTISCNSNPKPQEYAIITNIRNRAYYCFYIHTNLCRLVEMPCDLARFNK